MASLRQLAASARKPWRANSCYLLFCALVAGFCSIYAECAYEIAGANRTGVLAGIFFGTLTMGAIVRVLALFGLCFVVLVLLSSRYSVFDWIVDHRVALGAILLVALVVFEISGSSVAVWGPYLGEESFQGTLFGTPREIRSDEWLVFTPFSFSQVATGSHAVSSVIRGGNTNVTMVYGQPAWALATLFRPFLWGYLVLSTSRGLSFFWCTRAIVLVLVTYEFLHLLARGNRRIAAYGAILIGFSPIVEWWFAVNGTAELFIFGQGLVLALDAFLRSENTSRRWGWSFLLAWLAGCYILIMYPSWQIPLFYVFAALGVWVLVEWLRETKGDANRPKAWQLVVPLVVCLGLSIATVGLCVYGAFEVVQSLANSAYPGHRFFTGGGVALWSANTTANLLSPLWPERFTPNVCEAASFVTLHPLGLVLALVCLVRSIRHGSVDKALVCLFVPYLLLSLYGIVGLPPLLAKVTLLGNVQQGRLVLATQYIDILLLIRAVSTLVVQERSNALPLAVRICGLVATIAALCVATCYGTSAVSGIKAMVVLVCGLALLVTPLFVSLGGGQGDKDLRASLLLASSAVILVVGMCVNPVQRSADALQNSATLSQIREIVAEDPSARWLTDSSITGQACITTGAPTITSVNNYPNLELWKRIDPEGAYMEQYNRYALMFATLGERTTFENPTPDAVLVTLAPDDVPKLDVSYWLSSSDLSQWNTESTSFVPVKELGGLTVYRIQTT